MRTVHRGVVGVARALHIFRIFRTASTSAVGENWTKFKTGIIQGVN